MISSESTCWTMIRGAVSGNPDDRDKFARCYLSVVRNYISHRWRGRPHLLSHIDDAIQDVFLECFKQGGILETADPNRDGGFRAFLLGVVRNVALRRVSGGGSALEQTLDDETSLSRVFDRDWAKALLREAAERQAERAREDGPEALRRVELLRLRYQEGKQIQDIAVTWNMDAEDLHREATKARKEFDAALKAVVAYHYRGSSPKEIRDKCVELLTFLK
jgi:RNA polymerase sigma factor (sigma-70 family)